MGSWCECSGTLESHRKEPWFSPERGGGGGLRQQDSSETQLSLWLVIGTMGVSDSNLTVSNQMRGACPPLTEQESQSILSVRDVTMSAEKTYAIER